MKPYAIMDIEADKWINFVCLGFFDGTEYRVFRRVGDFINTLNNKRYDGWRVYAHYGGKYDFLFLLEKLFNVTSSIRIIDVHGRIISINVDLGRAKIQFADSYALLPDSLKNLTKAFQVEHVKGEYDFSRGVRYGPTLLKYLESDVLGLHEVLHKFSEYPYVDGNVKLTIGSQALDVFKRHFFNGDVVAMPYEYEDTFRREFYSGGRVEVYKGYGASVTGYDVNSLYPSAMLEEMPCGEMQQTSRYHPDKIGFYCVDITSTPEFYIPPYLVKTEDRNFYVNGPGRYSMSSATLNYLRSAYGVRFKVVYGFVFKKRAHLFVDYIRHFYQEKQTTTDPTRKMIAKYMLNTLYGKLGQSRNKETLVTQTHGQAFNISDSLSRFGLVAIQTYSRSKFILPYLAAYVTELARLTHWKFMQVDPESIYYGDTDSLYTTSRKYEAHVGTGIGQLKNEGTNEGIFLLPKTYALRNGRRCKISFKGFDAQKFTWRDFKTALHRKGNLVEKRERMLGFRECMNRKKGIHSQAGAFLKRVKMEKKTDVSAYDSRVVVASARFDFDTKAHYINDVS